MRIKYNQANPMQENDNYSEQDEQRTRKQKLQPLHLSLEELKERLRTLKDYATWKKTKAKRIRVQDIRQDQASPIINAALAYGDKNGRNDVLIEYIKNSENFKEDAQEHLPNIFEKLLNAHVKKEKKISHDDPSFINYKTTDHEKEKIYKMVKMVSQPITTPTRKTRAKTEQKITNKSAEKYPKELAHLKERLKELPVISKRAKTEAYDANPEEEASLQSQDNKETLGAKAESAKHSIMVQLSSPVSLTPFDNTPTRRTNYLHEIALILNRSNVLLRDGDTIDRCDDLRSSKKSSATSAIFSHDHPSHKKSKPLKYWPNYPKYSISQADTRKLDRLCSNFLPNSLQPNETREQISQMVHIMQNEFRSQQTAMDQEILSDEKNSFQHRFKHKITLERENYKRNVKELLRCKKDYKLEKQRMEIRANGIKRSKRVTDETVARKKTVEVQELTPEECS